MIPVYQPLIGERERQYVLEAVNSTWISSKGVFLDRFEHEFPHFLGATRGIATCNGTVSLHLMLAALGIGPGDEVIVPTLTYVASVNAISYTGATPVFVDSEPEYWNLDPRLLEAKITERTRALMVVHLYGNPCDMDRILEIAGRHNLAVVEDAAEAHGSEYKGRKMGTFGIAGSFSFFGNKVITTGEGGMVVTDDHEFADRCRHLWGQGVSPTQTYWHDVIGYNYRMSNVAAALGVAQLERIDEVLEKKRQVACWYRERLSDVEGIEFHREASWAKNNWWMVSIVVEVDRRDFLMKHLREQGIDSRPFFFPAHTLPMYLGDERFPIAERCGAGGINLPSWPGLDERSVDAICRAVRSGILGGAD